MEEILVRAERDERTLVVTLTKRMAEELTEYLLGHQVRCTYIHSDVDTMERVEIMNALRRGEYDVLVGVNLLREGLDLPEVSLVAILDADKEGFLRNHRSLTQTAGRAARNVNGRVIMYGDKITDSMAKTIADTNRRREKQLAYNEAHGITPKQIQKEIRSSLTGQQTTDESGQTPHPASNSEFNIQNSEFSNIAADPIVEYMSRSQLEKSIARTRKLMQEAAKQLNFAEAAQYRDEMFRLEEILKGKSE
jgi:excinuclease ABC subunit B